MNLVPIDPQLPQETAAQRDGLHWIQALDNQAWNLIQNISSFTVDQLFDLLTAGAALERTGWLVRCAAAAELLEKAAAVPVRREGDRTGEGRMALARELASRTNLSASTVLQDATIWQTFFTPEAQEELGDVSHLTDKTFYITALRTDAPLDVLREIAEEKAENPTFNTGDARRLIAIRHSPSLSAVIPSLAKNPEVRRAFESWQQATKALVQAIGPRGRQLANAQIEEWQAEIALPEMTLLERIEQLITEEGIDEIDPIAQRLGIDRQSVIAWFVRLRHEGWLTYTEKERVGRARGAARKSWSFTEKYYQEKGPHFEL